MICSLFFLWIYTDIFFNNCPELLCLFRIFQVLNIRTGMELQITLSVRASRKKKPSESDGFSKVWWRWATWLRTLLLTDFYAKMIKKFAKAISHFIESYKTAKKVS